MDMVGISLSQDPLLKIIKDKYKNLGNIPLQENEE